eukprot:67897-Pleurochrysis_carterae.AAC.1
MADVSRSSPVMWRNYHMCQNSKYSLPGTRHGREEDGSRTHRSLYRSRLGPNSQLAKFTCSPHENLQRRAAAPMTFTTAMDGLTERKRLGENGAAELTAAGVDDPLVCLFFKLVRNLPREQLDDLWAAATLNAGAQRMADLTVLAFQTRATRGMGKGEKRLFYELLLRLPQEALLATLPLVPFYGYFKDFFLLLERLSGTDLAPIVTERVIELLASQLLNDEKELT